METVGIRFANNKIQTEGIDFSTSALNNKNNNNNKLLKFTELDLLDIDKLNNYDYAYCRFLFHAISEDIEDVILKWLRKISKIVFSLKLEFITNYNPMLKRHTIEDTLLKKSLKKH